MEQRCNGRRRDTEQLERLLLTARCAQRGGSADDGVARVVATLRGRRRGEDSARHEQRGGDDEAVRVRGVVKVVAQGIPRRVLRDGVASRRTTLCGRTSRGCGKRRRSKGGVMLKAELRGADAPGKGRL